MSCYIGGKNSENCLRPLPIDENTRKFHPAPSGTIYDLGNGEKTDDADVASEKYMDREFPDVKNDPHGVTFIPEFFVSQYPNVLDPKDTNVLDEMKKRDVNKYKKDKFYNEDQVKGEISERRMFQQIMDVVVNAKDLVVFHSYNWITEKLEGEMDFLVVSLRTRTIINIECKSNMNKPKLKKALGQLEKHYNFITSTLSFGPGWQFVRVMSFTDDIRGLCDICKKFFIGPSSTFADVWNNIVAISSGTVITPALRQEYYNIVSHLAFKMSMNFPTNPGAKKSVASRKLQDNLDSISHPENIILWTRGQLAVLKDETQKMVFLRSTFGTGKTVLLKAKAVEIAKNHRDKRVFYITFPYYKVFVNWKQFIREEVEQFAKGRDNLQVMSWIDLEEEVRQTLVDMDEAWFEDKEQVFKTFVDIHLDNTAGIFVDEFYPYFLYEHMHSRNEVNVDILQPLKVMFYRFPEDEITSMHENVVNFWRKHSASLKSIKAKYPTNPTIQAFISAGRSIVGDSIMEDDNGCSCLPKFFEDCIYGGQSTAEAVHQPIVDKNSLWSFLSKFFEVWMRYMEYPKNMKFSDQNHRLFEDLRDITLERYFGVPEYKYSGGIFLRATLSAAHFLKHLSSLKEYNGLIWIVANGDIPLWRSKLLSDDITGFSSPTLEYNMRSVYNIADYASSNHPYKTITYEKPSNAILGKKPTETDVIELNRLKKNERVDELFGQFKIALEKLDNDTDDLLVIVDSFDDQWDKLYKVISEYCQGKLIPCCNCVDEHLNEEGFQNDMLTYMMNGRKGIVLGHFVSVQGFEFKSVILFRKSTHDILCPNIMLRARLNLCVIKYKL